MKYGYVRVSSKDQNTDRQLIAMKEAGIEEAQIYADHQTGKNFARPQYRKLYRKLKQGDILYIKSIDRLGRNYEEILEQWRLITHQRDVDIVVIDFPLLDTRNTNQGLTGKFIADLVLQILSYVAEVERDNIRQRQAEGIRAAMDKGVKFGRPNKPLPENFEAVLERWEKKEISLREASRILKVNHNTLAGWIKRFTVPEMDKKVDFFEQTNK